MKIAIVGTGNMGNGLAASFARAGHSVTFVSRDTDKAQVLAQKLAEVSRGDVKAVGYNAPIEAGVVILATPYWNNIALDTIGSLSNLSGKILIDITNPLAHDFMSNTIGHTTSAAEEIAKCVPGASVVKAFNAVFANSLGEGKQIFAEQRATGFYCGDDEEAKQVVSELILDAGFDPQDAGPLKNARYLEPLGQLNIQLGYGLGLGTDVGFRYLQRAA